MAETVNRTGNGRDSKGKFTKGNPGGGRKPIPQEFKELAESYSVEALQTVIDIIKNPLTETKDKLKAIEIVMDRGIGKATQQIDAHVTGEIEITVVVDDD